jgi:hypothetical protein
MAILDEAAFEEFVRSSTSSTHHDAYEAKLGQPNFDKKPHTMYFYYLDWLDNGLLDVRHYKHFNGDLPIEAADLPRLLHILARNAIDGGSAPPSAGRFFEDIEWDTKSYIAFMMRSDLWKLRKGVAIAFDPGRRKNQSFFDAQDFDIDISAAGNGSEVASAVCCVDHLKRTDAGDDLGTDAAGHPGPKEKQTFKFSLAFDISYMPGKVITIDPDGTNVGPPLPPPGLHVLSETAPGDAAGELETADG